MTRKRIIWACAAAALVGAVAFAAFWLLSGPIAYARIATGFVAQQTCACLHVSGRAFDSCMSEFPEDALSQTKIEREGQSVRASVLGGLISSEARYEEEFGCALVD